MIPRYLTTAELAEALRRSESTIRYWRMTGYGPPGIKIGKRVLYPEADVIAWLKEIHDQKL